MLLSNGINALIIPTNRYPKKKITAPPEGGEKLEWELYIDHMTNFCDLIG